MRARPARPAGTGGVRFATFGEPATPMSVTLRTGGETVTGQARNTSLLGNRVDADAFGETVGSDAGTPATACLRVEEGAMQVAGMAGLQADQQPSRLAGRSVEDRIAVWFLPPAGEQRSLLSAPPDASSARRCSAPGSSALDLPAAAVRTAAADVGRSACCCWRARPTAAAVSDG